MRTLGAALVTVEPGLVVIELTFRDALAQQHGFLHAGVVTAVVDSACGYAALSLMPRGKGVLSVEFKVNLIRPAAGVLFRATGRVVKPGRTLFVCTGELEAVEGAATTAVAVMQGTMMAVEARDGVDD